MGTHEIVPAYVHEPAHRNRLLGQRFLEVRFVVRDNGGCAFSRINGQADGRRSFLGRRAASVEILRFDIYASGALLAIRTGLLYASGERAKEKMSTNIGDLEAVTSSFECPRDGCPFRATCRALLSLPVLRTRRNDLCVHQRPLARSIGSFRRCFSMGVFVTCGLSPWVKHC